MGCCETLVSGTLRIILFALNLCTLVAGGAVLGLGVYILVEINFLPEDNAMLDGIAYGLIGLGMLVAVVSLLGCLGACMQNQWLLSFYFLFVLLLVIAEVGVGIFFAVEKDRIEAEIDKNFKEWLDEYKENEEMQEYVNVVQGALKCCGYNGARDYLAMGILNLPDTCYVGDIIKEGALTYPGCKQRISTEIKGKSTATILVIASVAALEVLTMLMACYLRKKQLEDVIVNNPPYSF